MDEYVADLLTEASGESHLDLGGLGLTEIPDGVFDLVSLTHLSLRGNDIGQVSPEIGRLVGLRQLSLADNELTELPEEIGALLQLKSLNLKNNLLTALPLGLLGLEGLERLQLSGNRLGIPADLVGKYDRPQEILDYYRAHCVVMPEPPPRPLSVRVAEAFTELELAELIDELCVPLEEVEAGEHGVQAEMVVAYHERYGLGDELMGLLKVLRPGRF